MIAYDLDGVLISDMVVTPENLTRMLSTRVEDVYPSFLPMGEYAIITGRPVDDRSDTVDWLHRFFQNSQLIAKIFKNRSHMTNQHICMPDILLAFCECLPGKMVIGTCCQNHNGVFYNKKVGFAIV